MVRLLLLLSLALPFASHAIPPLPQTVADKIPGLRLAGEGRLRWLGLHIYDAALWTREGSFSVRSEFALDIRYVRNVTSKRLVKTSVKEMRRLGFANRSRLNTWADEMARVFPDIRKGDRLTGVNLPGLGAEFYHNGRLIGFVADEKFAFAFFSIWLDPRTREPGLRESLFGQR
ncbi:MAG: hypothetical protein GTO41_12775 [Burkholderiales bacterium]|nr:hypothetical protein [Burkholderiales bacterium]